MRANYDSWYKTMMEQDAILTENNPTMVSLLHAKSRKLLGVTRPKNLQGWSKLTAKLMLKQQLDREREKESMLDSGEVRVELTSVRLNKNGFMKMGTLAPG